MFSRAASSPPGRWTGSRPGCRTAKPACSTMNTGYAYGIVRGRLICPMLLLMLGAGTAGGQGSGSETGLPPRAGWVETGTRYPLYTGRGIAASTFPARIVAYSPAQRVTALAAAGDTLWIGTDGGLFAYSVTEDSTAAVSGPVSRSVRSIAFDEKGALLVGGDRGVSIRRGGAWLHYTVTSNRFFEDVTDISHGEGRMWLGSYGRGAACVEGDSITVFARADSLFDDRVLSVIEENPCTVWFATASGLCMADTLHWMSMRYGSRLPIGAVRDILFDEGGRLYCAIAMQGVAVYNLGRVGRYGPNDGLPNWDINAFSLDPTGRIWAVGKGGVSIFDGSGWTPLRLSGYSAARYNFLSCFHDVEGGAYLGTDEGTILYLSRDTVGEIHVPQAFPSGRVARIRPAAGELWFLTGSGLFVKRGGIERVELPKGVYGGAIEDVTVYGDEVWVVTRFGLLHYDGQAWKIFDRRQGLPTEHFTVSIRDGSGDIWFGAFERGVLRLTGRGWVHYNGESGLPDMRIENIIEDRSGTMWVMTACGGIARFTGDSWQEVILPVQEGDAEKRQPQADSLPRLDPAIRFLGLYDGRSASREADRKVCIGLDGTGNCLVGRSDAVYRYSESGWQIMYPPAVDGEIEPTVIMGSSRGDVWLGTARHGVFISRRGTWHGVDRQQGLSDGTVLAIVEDAAGDVWIGTQSGGAVRFIHHPSR